MELPENLSAVLRIDQVSAPPTEHKWNQLLGVELELENVFKRDGSYVQAYGDDEFPYHDYDWDEMTYEEQQDARDEWHSNNSSTQSVPAGWTLHHDQSLRNGIEFVTSPAVSGQELEDRINAFYSHGYAYEGGARTSTHIHVNMSDSTPEVLQSIVMLTYMVENALYKVIGEARKWGGYSVALVDMSPYRLRNLLNPPSHQAFRRAIDTGQNRDRYYGLNVNASRHGTVEFRYFPGAPSKEELCSWVDYVVKMKQVAQRYTPDALGALLTSVDAVAAFLKNEFGDWGYKLMAYDDVNFMLENFEEINAIRTDDVNLEREGSVVYLNPNLIDFLVTAAFDGHKETAEYLRTSGAVGAAISVEDAVFYMGRANGVFNQALMRDPSNTHVQPPEEAPYPPDYDLTWAGDYADQLSATSRTMRSSRPTTTRPVTRRLLDFNEPLYDVFTNTIIPNHPTPEGTS